MLYVKSLDGVTADKYPYDVYQARQDYPNVSFPQYGFEAMTQEELALSWKTFYVNETPPPPYDPETEVAVDSAVPSETFTAIPTWNQVWTVEPLPV